MYIYTIIRTYIVHTYMHIYIHIHTYMANAMGKYNESAYNKGVLSKYKGQIEHQNNINTKLHSICNISWKNQVVPTPF